MNVNAIDHVNIVTDDLKATTQFFVNVFDLEARNGPTPRPPEHMQWLYDKENRAIFHINSSQMPQQVKRNTEASSSTGAIHHIALACTGYNEFLARLKTLKIEFQLNEVPSVQTKQVFLTEPNGVLLELNFRGEC